MDPERFALESFEDGGALLDLESGMLFRLNRTATDIWTRALAAMDPSAIADELALAYQVPIEKLHLDIAATLHLPDNQALPSSVSKTPVELTYSEAPGGYLLSMNGKPAIEIDVQRKTIRVLAGVATADYGICLRTIAPKLVARTGPTVLHAAAVARRDQKVTAFLGINGAGKTTTARIFSAQGCELICEDKLVIRGTGSYMNAVLDAESKINKWIVEARHALEAHPEPYDSRGLALCSEGRSLPISDVYLLSSERRHGNAISLRRLPPSEAASEIFQNAFYGSALAFDWRRQLAAIARLARRSAVFEATLPNGIDALAQAIRRYSETTAS